MVRQIRIIDPNEHMQHLLGQHGQGQDEELAEEGARGLACR